MRPWLVLTVVIGIPGLVSAQGVPRPVVVDGLKIWSGGHCPDAIKAWTKKWSKESGADQLVGGCDDFQTFGAVHGYDVIRVVDVTPNLQRIYVLLRYEEQPVYLSLVAYAYDPANWEVVAVNWNTDPDKIVPREILPPQHVVPTKEAKDSE